MTEYRGRNQNIPKDSVEMNNYYRNTPTCHSFQVFEKLADIRFHETYGWSVIAVNDNPLLEREPQLDPKTNQPRKPLDHTIFFKCLGKSIKLEGVNNMDGFWAIHDSGTNTVRLNGTWTVRNGKSCFLVNEVILQKADGRRIALSFE